MRDLIFSLFTLFIVFRASAASEKRKCILSSRFEVRVVNNIDVPNSVPIYLHCLSGDNDLGTHVLYKNQEFNWNFCEKIIGGTTLFHCHIVWSVRDARFDAFNSDHRDRCIRSKVCYWAAKNDGIYFTGDNSTKSLTKMYPWNISLGPPTNTVAPN